MAITPYDGGVPSRQSPSTFSARMDAWIAWFTNTAVAELNAFVASLSSVLAGLFTGSSSSSVATGTGAKSFNIPGRSFAPGQWVMIARTSNPTGVWMFGQVTSYADPALAVNVTVATGSGTYTDWTVSLSGPNGAVAQLTRGQAFVLALIAGD